VPHVLFLVHSLDVGGIENYLLRLLRYAGPRLRATVLCKSGGGGHLEPAIVDSGASILKLHMGRTGIRNAWKFYRALRKGQFDAVCDFSGNFSAVPLLLSKVGGIGRRIAFYREAEYQFKPDRLRVAVADALGYLTRTVATHIFSNSAAALDRFQRGWRRQSADVFRVVRNPIPVIIPALLEERVLIRSKLGIPPDAFVVVHVGRVTAAKNHRVVLQVASQLVSECHDVFCLLCGRGVTELEVGRALSAGDASRIVRFEHIDNILGVLDAADAFFFPSLNEGMPNALVEAMSAGCRIVASDIVTIREVFPERWNKYLVDPVDVGSAVAKLNALKAGIDPTYGDELREWAISNFSTSTTLEPLIAVLCGRVRTP